MSPDTTLKVGQQVNGFEINDIAHLPNIQAKAVRGWHRKSGAQLLHVHNADSENCFAVTFPTPPPDDTGLPHILEHSVLGGSRRFPVREPFFEMVKMSMASFINAMTDQAFTVYPVSSPVKKDFFNLVEVYLDAVFHPELKEDTFRREGHHFTLINNDDLNSALSISGIVYNEMKAGYSRPESLLWKLTLRGLYPNTLLGLDSGGDPDHIPELTYDQFRRFHETFYHPSNALIFIYGDIPTEEHFHYLSPVLDAFEHRPVKIDLPRSRDWLRPDRVEKEYPIGTSEDTGARTFFTLNWVVGDALDPAKVTAWEVLSKILIGNEAAPLKKALIDSKLGSDVFFAGTVATAYEQEFRVGLKGSEPDRAEKFESLVLETLQRIAAEPISEKLVDAAFQQLAYDHLEVKSFFPLRLLLAVDQSWPYGGDPLTFLRMGDHLEACRQRYAVQNDIFNRLIQDGLVDNKHRLIVILRPDREAQARADAAFSQRMARQRAEFTPEQIAGIARSASELEAAQGKPNSPEALAKLPQLRVKDLPAKPLHIPTEIARVAGIEVLRNEVFTNGVNYVAVDVDLAGLPPDLYAWLPRFCEAVDKMGAAGQSFTRVAERRAAFTGGLRCSTLVCRHATESTRTLRRLRFGMKSLDAKAEAGMRLLGDLVFDVDPRDRHRLRDVITQTEARYRATLVGDGWLTARRQAARGLSPEGALEYQFLSREALKLVQTVMGAFDTHAGQLVQNIERIRDFVANRARWTVSFTGSDAAFRIFTGTLEEWAARMNGQRIVDAPAPFEPFVVPPREGLAAPIKIAHCVKMMPAPHLAHPDVPLFRLGAYLAEFDYMLSEIRFKGNAYGADAVHDDALGIFRLHSFADPHIVETLRIFDGLGDFIAEQKWTQADVDRAIIGSAKEAEKPIRPEEATGLALTRHIRGDTNELRELRYADRFRATPRLVKQTFLKVLEANEAKSAVCVVSSRHKLEDANRSLQARALVVTDILD
jgi:hypothetical protein